MKKTMIASLAAAGMLFAVAGQAHAGTTLDAVKRKVLFNAVSVTVCLASLMPMRTANLPVLMWMSAVALQPPFLVMTAK